MNTIEGKIICPHCGQEFLVTPSTPKRSPCLLVLIFTLLLIAISIFLMIRFPT